MGYELLRVDGVTKRFGGLVAVKDVGFSVQSGTVKAIIGPNGAGKSTLVNIIAGVYKPDSGRVLFCGEDITLLRPFERCHRGIARTFQITRDLGDLTVFDSIVVGAFRKTNDFFEASKRTMELLDNLGLSDYANAPLSAIPSAAARLAEFARALITQPKLILIDELMAGLTPVEVDMVVGYIRSFAREDTAIIMIEHVMRAVMALADDVVVLNSEVVAIGTPQEIVRQPEVIRIYLGESQEKTSV